MNKFITLQSAYNIGLLTSGPDSFDVVSTDGMIFKSCAYDNKSSFFHWRNGDIISIPTYRVLGVKTSTHV
jgi:hypothetical protein